MIKFWKSSHFKQLYIHSYWFLRFSILITHAHLHGIWLGGRRGNSICMAIFLYKDHFNGSLTPIIVTLVVAVVTGRPRRSLLSWGHIVTIPYTTVLFPCFFVVYLKQSISLPLFCSFSILFFSFRSSWTL